VKSQVENVSDVKKVIHFEIPWEDVDKHIKEATRNISKNARIPGFRPGKAPESLIRTRYAEHIKEDVMNHLIPQAYREVLDENKFDVISEPAIHDVKYSEGSPFLFQVTIETRPSIEPKEYKGLEVKNAPVSVTDEDVDSVLKNYQERTAELIPREEAAQTGNYLNVHVKATLDKKVLVDRETLIEVGNEGNHPAFNENLPGKKAGETVEFDAVYPEDSPEKTLAGKTIHYTVKIVTVNDKKLPNIDDDFAKDLGDFSSLADLKEKIRKDLLEMKSSEQKGQQKDEILKQIIDKNPFEVPEGLVRKETEHLMQDYAYSMQKRGANLKEIDWKELQTVLGRQADQNIRGSMLIETIADLEKIEVKEEDLDNTFQKLAEQHHRAPEAVKAEFVKEEKMDALKNRIRVNKTLDFLLDQAKLTEEVSNDKKA